MIEWKCHSFDLLMRAIDEACDSEVIRLIDRLWSMKRVNHWPDDDIWVDDCQVKRQLVFLHELPCRSLRAFFGDIVAEDSIISLDRLLGRNLIYR